MFSNRPLPPRTSPPPIPSFPDLRITNLYGFEVLDSTLSDASRFISKNYGLWSQNPRLRRRGRPILMSRRLIQSELFPRQLHTQAQIVRALRLDAPNAERYCGHVIAVNWVTPEGVKVCWIAHMVVKEGMRGLGIAEAMLTEVKKSSVMQYDVFGVVSAHPHAIMAVCRVFGGYGVEEIDVEFMRERAARCMEFCPVRYVREGNLRGTLWGLKAGDVAVASLDTEFMVEEEPLRIAMANIFARGRRWPLGALPEGHEWLCVVKADWGEPELEPEPVAVVVGDEANIDPRLLVTDATIDPRLL